MAGGLTISTLNDSSGVLATQNGMSGICKSWVNFNGTTTPPTIRASFNVGSVTKNSTGDYTVNFTTAMPDTNYSVAGIVQYDQSSSTINHNLMGAEIRNTPTAMQTTSVRVVGMYGGDINPYNMITFCVSVFR